MVEELIEGRQQQYEVLGARPSVDLPVEVASYEELGPILMVNLNYHIILL